MKHTKESFVPPVLPQWLFENETAQHTWRESGQTDKEFHKGVIPFIFGIQRTRIPKKPAVKPVVTEFRTSTGLAFKVSFHSALSAVAVMLPTDAVPSAAEIRKLIKLEKRKGGSSF